MLSGTREAGCFREVAALHSDHLRQVPLYLQMALSFRNFIMLLLKQAGTPYCYAHICTSEVYIASHEHHCAVALQGGLE